jgi:hypothetical protein
MKEGKGGTGKIQEKWRSKQEARGVLNISGALLARLK